MREGLDPRARTNAHIAQYAVGPDADAIGQHHAALEHGIDINADIASAMQTATHIQPRRISQGHTLLQQLQRDIALMHPLQFGQLQAAVHA